MNTLCYNALRVVGDAYGPVIISLATTWVIAFPLAWWLVVERGMGPAGLWWAMAAEESVKCLILLTRWNRMGWIRFVRNRTNGCGTHSARHPAMGAAT